MSINLLVRAACGALMLTASAAATSAQQRADLILFNGDVVTVDSAHPRAQAIAVKGDRILAVGSNAEIPRLANKAPRRIDCQASSRGTATTSASVNRR
jgi:adenine deaminase